MEASHSERGTRIRAEVRARARKERILRTGDLTFSVAVREPAQHGAANARVRELLATELQVPAQALRLLRGATTSHKTYLLTNPRTL